MTNMDSIFVMNTDGDYMADQIILSVFINRNI